MIRRLVGVLLLVLASTPAWAQRVSGDRGVTEATPVRCVNIAGTAFEACGGGAGGGVTDTDDNSIAFAQTPGLNIALNYVSNGAVWSRLVFGQTTMSASLPVTFASDQSALHTICDSGCGSPPATADGTAFTFGTTNVSPIAFVVDDVASTTVTENSYGAARMSGSRILYFDLSKTAANATAIKVDGSAVTQPISGTVAATQSGTWTVQPGNTANTTPWLFQVRDAAGNARGANVTASNALVVDGSGVTQPVSGTVTAVQGTGSNLHVVCDSGCSSSAGFADNSAFTFGTTAINPIGGVFDDVATNTATENSAAVARITAQKAVHTNLRNNAGTEVGTAATPLQVTLANTGANTNKLLVTPDSVALPANQSVNVSQLAGTTTDTNSGNKSAGTLRVVLATDQPALTNKLLVTPDSVALPANQSVNVAQVAGTATDTNSGTKSAGTIRVVLATDQPALTNKLLVTPDSVALPANQSVNVAQMNGVATTMGAGATGTGVQRVNDVASSATGAAPPASAIYVGGLGSGATGGFLTGVSVGDSNKVVNVSTATTTLMVTGVSGRQVHITAFHLMTNAANSVAWLEGTGATCGTGTAGMAGGTTAASGYNFAANGGIAMGSGYGDVLATATTGDSVCLITSAATQLSGFIKYTIY